VDEFAEERPKSEIISNTGEDDWVEVKAPSTSFETNRDVAASLKSSVKMVIDSLSLVYVDIASWPFSFYRLISYS